MERQWQYLAQNGDTKGPFPESVLLRMLVKGVPGLEMKCYAWCTGMADWTALENLEPFKGVKAAQETMWYYLDESQQNQGPIDAQSVSKLWDDGQIDGMTMMWHGGMPEWKPVAEVAELKQLLQILSSNHDDDDEEDAAEGGAAGGAAAEDMVFQSDEIPTLSSVLKDNGGGGGSSSNKEAAAAPHKKSFVADDGVRYRFNPQSQDWEEADSGYESDEEEGASENGEEEGEAEARPKAKKKKEEDGGGGEEGNNGETKEEAEKKKKKKKNKKKRGQDWDDKAKNRWVYVSGLPSDVTVNELDQHFKQCGVIAMDPESGEPKIKLYRDDKGVPKGDASISYVKAESVELAIEILHDGYLRPNLSNKISVSKAVFQKKGDTFVAKKAKVSEAKIKVAKQAAQQALTWAEEDDSGLNRAKALRIVVLKNMFHPTECQEEGYVEELQGDLDTECSQLGPIEKITVFERHPEGVVIIKFATAYAAEQCIKLMNGRWFGGRQLKCLYWDGVTDFTKAVYVPPKEDKGEGALDELDEEEKRLDEFGDELDNQELPDEFALEVEPGE